MEIKIQSIHFDATEKLEAFIEKKVAKLEKSFEDIQKVEVQLKIESSEACNCPEQGSKLVCSRSWKHIIRREDERHF